MRAHACASQNTVRDGSVKVGGVYPVSAYSVNHVYVVSGARENLQLTWFAPLSGEGAPQPRAIAEFRRRAAADMGNRPDYGDKAEVTGLWKKALSDKSLGDQFISSKPRARAKAYPTLDQHFGANAAKQRGAPTPTSLPPAPPPSSIALSGRWG
jgi:hypothetical protein